MVMTHRKLFPSLTSTNQTTGCPEFCDSSCSYECYSYPDYSYFSPPPPLPPSPTSGLDHQNNHVSLYVIIIVSLLIGFFLIVSYYVIIVKSCGGWCNWRNNRTPQAQTDGTDEEFLENQVDHPIWFITTVGLQQTIINSITVCKYKKGEGLIEGTDCSVCLTEFQEGETLRLLPKCNHAFHIPCIDTWLRSHTNCPLCRARIISDAATASLVSIEQSSDNMSQIGDTQMENTGINNNLGVNHGREREFSENRTGSEEECEIVQVNDGTMLKESVNTGGDDVIKVIRDSGTHHQCQKDDVQPIRRSVSMDSSFADTVSLSLRDLYPHGSTGSSVDVIEDAEKLQFSVVTMSDDDVNSSIFRQMSSSSVEQYLHKSPVPMKRSVSCSGRFFSSRRHNRSLNAILPL